MTGEPNWHGSSPAIVNMSWVLTSKNTTDTNNVSKATATTGQNSQPKQWNG